MECPQSMRSYMEALEEERRKIEVFRRELPLCLFLVTQAIEECRNQLSERTTITTATASMDGMNGQISESSEQNSMKGPVLEEFIPIKRASSSDNNLTDHDSDDDDGDEQHSPSNGDDDTKKSNWLKSVQLWNPNPETTFHHEGSPAPRRGLALADKANTGGLQPSLGIEKAARKSSQSSGEAASPLPPTGAASTSSMGGGQREEKQKPGGAQRKQRRCWSADLHRRFVHALQQVGGPHVATPKQIRELMKVDGLTNDEVKSHLQKYRLHAKSPPGQNGGGNAQSPQFVVGGVWVPTPQPRHPAGSAAPTTPEAAHGMYAPVATPLLPSEAAKVQAVSSPSQMKCRGSSYEEHGSSNSATTSSSGRTVTDC